MSYNDLIKVANIVDNKKRLVKYAEYYKDIEINGLHYVNFIPSSNTISISRPNHTTHHEATSYLLFKKNCTSINTTKGQANDLKKFLDYLLIWDIDLLCCDLYIIILGFVDYLRSIQSGRELTEKSIHWSYVTKVPLHEQSYSVGQIAQIGYSKDGFMNRINWSELQYSTIQKTVSTAIQFLGFLKERTTKYKSLQLNQIPVKIKYKNTVLSGTLGKMLIKIIDIEAMLKAVGLEPDKSKESLLLKQKVFTIDEMDSFMGFIPDKHRQNRFLFYVLKFFGLRASEAANLMIDTSTLPKNLLFMKHFEAKEYIKNNFKGDIEYSTHINKWVCYVIKRENPDYRSQHKSGSRDIPLLFSEEFFLDLLLDALREREILIRYATTNHSYLFVSLKSGNRGNPINGESVKSKYINYANKILKTNSLDFTNFSPHSFRHFFATYLLKVKKQDISDVSRWLGHADISITRNTYSHYLPNKNETIEVVQDMANQFGKGE